MWSQLRSPRIALAASATVAVSLQPRDRSATYSYRSRRGRRKWPSRSQALQCQEISKSVSQELREALHSRKEQRMVVKLADVVHEQAGRHRFDDVYTKGAMIGEGGFGKVWLAKHRTLGHEVAVKTMERHPDKEEELFHEIDTLLKLDHPHIVKLIAYFKEKSVVNLVFEVCRGPELYEELESAFTADKTMPEGEIALVMRHMLKAIRGCHSNLMGHYDIKPENFMYAGKDLDNLKMIDLGASNTFKMGHLKGKNYGTPEYMAPEFHDGIYGPAGDVFSCGIVLFVMLTGELFFPGDQGMTALNELSKDRKWMQRRIKDAQVHHGFSDDALDLLTQMLRLDRHRRISVKHALEHPFLLKSFGHERIPARDRVPSEEHMNKSIDHFRRYSSYPIVKRAARLILAHILPRILARPQRLAYRTFDMDGFGEMSAEAFEEWFRKKDIQIPEDFDKIVGAVDVGCSGYVNFTEFLAAGLPAEATQDPRYCKAVFNILDADGDGVISATDLNKVFRSSSVQAWSQALAEVCIDGSPLTWERFYALMDLPSQSWA